MAMLPDFSDSPGPGFAPEGDPVLRMLVVLVDVRAVRDVRVTLNVAGLALPGILVSASDYAFEVSELLNEKRLTGHCYVAWRERVEMGSPEADDMPAMRAESVTHLHLRRDDPNPQAWQKNKLHLWRAPFTSVDAWTFG